MATPYSLTPDGVARNQNPVTRSTHADRNGFEPREGYRPFHLSHAESTLGLRFREVASRHDSKRAIISAAGEALSYQELLRRSLCIAGGLLDNLRKDEQPVIVLAPQSIEAIEAILAILFAGFTYLPLDPSLPGAEVSRICAVARPAALLSIPDANRSWPIREIPSGIPCFDIAAMRKEQPLTCTPNSSPQQPAALFATSGTTGKPKLVTLSHRAILFDIGRQTNDLYLGPDDRFDLLFSTGFSASLAPLFGALLNGAELHPLDLRINLDHETPRLLDWLETRKITVSNMATSTFRMAASTAQPAYGRCPRLRLLSLGAESVLSSDLQTFRRTIGPPCVLQNAMASTETRTYAQYFYTGASNPPEPLPIGWPVWGKDVLLLDDEGNSLSGPQEGEIVISSGYLANGYSNDAAQTAERFQPREDGLVLFRTGDRASRSEDGCLTFLGRTDALVKVRGYRVELDAIESIMRKCEGVGECAVVAQENPPGNVFLIAFYTAAAGTIATDKTLRSYLETELPPYMNPSAIRRMDHLPRTPNGKIDRHLLRKLRPDSGTSNATAETTAYPQTQTTVALLETIARSLLPHARIHADASLFESAIDSLALLQFLLAVEKRFDVRLSPHLIRQRHTLRQLAAVLDMELSASRSSGQRSIRPQIVPLPGEGPRHPVYFVHPITGSADTYYSLAERMLLDRPTFGIHAPSYVASDHGLTIETIASRYLDSVRESLQSLSTTTNRFSPSEVVFAGFSFGGSVAYEMARQFAESHAAAPPVVIVDIPATSPHRSHLRIASDAVLNLPSWLRYNGLRRSPRDLFLRIRPALRKSFHAASQNGSLLVAPVHPPTTSDLSLEIHRNALSKYRPLPYRGKVIVLRTVALLGSSDPSMGWTDLARSLSIGEVPGRHDTWLDPRNLADSAAILRRHLTTVA